MAKIEIIVTDWRPPRAYEQGPGVEEMPNYWSFLIQAGPRQPWLKSMTFYCSERAARAAANRTIDLLQRKV